MNTLLLILDGWGYSTKTYGNAIALAKKPNYDWLWKNAPHALLSASGLDVGLPDGQMGNSEVGHLHIGAGEVVMQELTNLELAIQNGDFFKNPTLMEALNLAKNTKKKVHILGLLSTGGVHSHLGQIEAMVEMAVKNGNNDVFVHAFLDGRDTPPHSAEAFINKLELKMKGGENRKIASLCGRFYAMDRDNRWERVEKAYNLLTEGKSEYCYSDAITGLQAAYSRGESDEFVEPTLIDKNGLISDGDIVIFMNFRADRARELSYAFTKKDFDNFKRKPLILGSFVTLTQYAKDLETIPAYPPRQLKNVLGEVLAAAGLRQLHIAETEKYAHVTYFINGGKEEAFPGEERVLVPSPKVATYDLKPEMNLPLVVKELTKAIKEKKFDFIVANFANPDMVGHTGNLEATIKAIEAVDYALGRVATALMENDGELVIIADHGNAEQMLDPETHNAYTAHTTNKVPFIYYGKPAESLVSEGRLIDVAPTILEIMGLNIPKEMTGKRLIKRKES